MGAILTLEGVRHRRGTREVLHVDALTVAAGERLGVLGPNGAGKTTLLRLLAALEPPTEGRVEIDGALTARAGAALRRRIAYAPQDPILLSTTVMGNVELPLRYRRMPRRARRDAATAALARLGVEHLAERPASHLSGGEAQRVSLARALATAPVALLLDEPTAGLDTPTRAAFYADARRALADRAATVVLVSHRSEEVLSLSDRVAVLIDGRLHQVAAPAELVTQPADAAVARLLGYENVIDVRIDHRGEVLVAGRPTALTTSHDPGPATLAVWAGGVRLHPAGEAPLPARVVRTSTGPGRLEVALDAGVTLHAHLPLAGPPRQTARIAPASTAGHAHTSRERHA
jgi:ABC-type sulfate/molybdate transport systems ATPase subunit